MFVATALVLSLWVVWPGAARPVAKVLAAQSGHFPVAMSNDMTSSSDQSAPRFAAPSELEAEPVDLCAIDPTDKSLDPAVSRMVAAFAARADGAVAELVGRIEADPDPYVRAIGELMRGQDKAAAAMAASAAASTIALSSLQPNPALGAVVKEASTTGDARLYALAITTCRTTAIDGCVALSAAQWIRLDPGNATPWLFMLNDAARRGDVAGVDDALFHMARSSRFDSRFHTPTSVVADHADTSTDAGVSAAMTMILKAVGIQVLASWPSFQAATTACNAPAIAAANADRHQICDQIAELFSEHSDTLIATTIGSSMGRRLGWSDDRVDAIRGVRVAADDAWQEGSATETASSPSSAFGCNTLRTQMARMQRTAELGEAGWARDFMHRSGQSAATYAKRARAIRLESDAQMRSAGQAPAASVARSNQ